MKKALLLSFVALGLSACGGNSTSTPPAAPTIDVSGVWVIDLSPVDARLKLTLTQSGKAINGDAEAAYYVGTLVDLYEPFGKAQGTVGADQYKITATASGKYTGNIILNGTIIAGKMSGNWSGAGTGGKQAKGSFVGTKQ